MKIPANIDAVEFMKVVNSCRGTVELVSPEGDCINLKSTLSQYLSIASILSSDYSQKLNLIVYEQDDVAKLSDFLDQNISSEN